MGKSLIAACAVALTASCAMYGDPAPRVKNPPPIRHTEIVEKDPPKVYIDDCDWKVVQPTKAPKRDVVRSDQHVKVGDTAAVGADKAAVPADKTKLLIDSIQEYGAALERDPFNAEATLKLALAYDKVLRRGCALALLDRLGKLADHPTYERSATERIDDVENHKSWFGDYRKDALKALKR